MQRLFPGVRWCGCYPIYTIHNAVIGVGVELSSLSSFPSTFWEVYCESFLACSQAFPHLVWTSLLGLALGAAASTKQCFALPTKLLEGVSARLVLWSMWCRWLLGKRSRYNALVGYWDARIACYDKSVQGVQGYKELPTSTVADADTLPW
jgi:hypothetical protein